MRVLRFPATFISFRSSCDFVEESRGFDASPWILYLSPFRPVGRPLAAGHQWLEATSGGLSSAWREKRGRLALRALGLPVGRRVLRTVINLSLRRVPLMGNQPQCQPWSGSCSGRATGRAYLRVAVLRCPTLAFIDGSRTSGWWRLPRPVNRPLGASSLPRHAALLSQQNASAAKPVHKPAQNRNAESKPRYGL
jgi:hypothetical protein